MDDHHIILLASLDGSDSRRLTQELGSIRCCYVNNFDGIETSFNEQFYFPLESESRKDTG